MIQAFATFLPPNNTGHRTFDDGDVDGVGHDPLLTHQVLLDDHRDDQA